MLEFTAWREFGVGGPPSGRLVGFSRWTDREAFLAAVPTIRSMAPWRKAEWDEHPDEVLMLEPAEPSQRLSGRPSPEEGYIFMSFHHLEPGRLDQVVRSMVERAELMAQAPGFIDAGPWVVLAWLTGGDPPVTPIVGVSTAAQLDEALAGVSLALTDEQRRRLEAAS